MKKCNKEVTLHSTNYKLEDRNAKVKGVLGVGCHRCFHATSSSNFGVFGISSDSSDLAFLAANVEDDQSIYLPGKYIACMYDND